MPHWWRQRRASREDVIRQADELIALHGADAYGIARDHRVRTLQEQQHIEHRFWSAVARCIAERTGRQVGLDTATRYLEALPRHRDDPSADIVPATVGESAPINGEARALRELRLVTSENNVIMFPALPSARRARGRLRPGCGWPGRQPG